MLSLVFCLVVVSWLSVPCNALPGFLAPRTSGGDYGPSPAAWTPRPTTFAENVHKRDALLGYETCGFIGGNYSRPLTCADVTKTCLVDEPPGVVGCCATIANGSLSGLYTNCKFATSCINYGPAGSETDQYILACSEQRPICQTYSMSYDGLLLPVYGCGISYVFYPAVQALTSLPTYTDTLIPSLTSPVPSLSTATSPVSSTASTKKTLSHGQIAGIAVGTYYLLVIFGSSLTLFVYYMSKWRNMVRRSIVNSTGPEPGSPRSPPQVPSSPLASFAPKGNDEERFLAFLISFGSNGIIVRELIMLASLRLAPETSRNHWLTNGERGRLQDAINAQITYADSSFLEAFTRDASTVQSIDILQASLEKFGLVIDYQYARGTHLPSQQSWFMDARIWRMTGSYPRESRVQLLLEVFLEVFKEMPCKDISPLAERQREMYYYHAHQALVHLHKHLVWSLVRTRYMTQVVFVILQVLSHRFQRDDEALLRFAKENLPKSGLHPDWNIILLVAELKATISTNCDDLSQIREKVFEVVEVSITQAHSSTRAKGLSGWLLVELLDAVEAQDRIELIDAVVQMGQQWMRSLLGSELSSLEQTMLCRVFARFGTSDYLEPQPRQYHLLFGYQLSRAGCIEKAEELLLSGLEFYASSTTSARLWSYRFELVSLMLRAGRWSEAEAWLASARKSAIYRDRVIHHTDFWKRSGECGETFILLGLYQADCDMAMGKLKSAEDRLKDSMEKTLFVRDSYIRALRLALGTRLLNVQMWQEIWEPASVTAQDLVEDTLVSGHCLSTTRISCSLIIIVLTLINKLLWLGKAQAAARLLESLKRFEDADHHVLPVDIRLYLERRRATVSHLLSIEGSSAFIQHLEDSGADAEDAITFASVAQGSTSENPDIQATGSMPSHSGASPLKHSLGYKWSSELEHARFPTPEVQELVDWEIQSHEAKVLDTSDTGSAQPAKHRGKRGRVKRAGTRRGAVHRGSPLAEKLAQAPHPPTHEPLQLNPYIQAPLPFQFGVRS